jgi:predicted nucleic acid-binding protein
MKFLVDTDIASYAINGNKKVLAKMKANIGNWAISSLTYHELVEGLMNCKSKEKEILITEFLEDVLVVEFTSIDAFESGRLSNRLRKTGKRIGDLDTLIAGHALSLRTILVSNNEKHYSKVKELKLENWSK